MARCGFAHAPLLPLLFIVTISHHSLRLRAKIWLDSGWYLCMFDDVEKCHVTNAMFGVAMKATGRRLWGYLHIIKRYLEDSSVEFNEFARWVKYLYRPSSDMLFLFWFCTIFSLQSRLAPSASYPSYNHHITLELLPIVATGHLWHYIFALFFWLESRKINLKFITKTAAIWNILSNNKFSVEAI